MNQGGSGVPGAVDERGGLKRSYVVALNDNESRSSQ